MSDPATIRPELSKSLSPLDQERERGASEVPRKIWLWRFKKRPARRLRSPICPLFLPVPPGAQGAGGHKDMQRCDISRRARALGGPFRTPPSFQSPGLFHGAARSSRKVPVAFRSLVKSGKRTVSEVLKAGIDLASFEAEKSATGLANADYTRLTRPTKQQ